MTTAPRLALPYILTQRAQKEVTHAAGLNRLDAPVQPIVQQIRLNKPPASPADGACWIIGTSPTGVWAGQANRLAQWSWNGIAWTLAAPQLLQASVTDDPPTLAASTGVTTSLTGTGAVLGGYARASFSLDLQGITLTA
ncbi:DUF2793 domain-containing protein [Falsiroseomonas sp.]|uniref:DUF2793 domain-containing protein n=1 Tax=Falsiroseomonas sp. TaxID=2870721 RepID=UPI003562FFBE